MATTARIIHDDGRFRQADVSTLLNQIGAMNVLAMAGGRWHTVYATGESGSRRVGIALTVGTGRVVEVTLAADDTYTVRRVRTIFRGARQGEEVEEVIVKGVYADQVGEVAYQASLWRQ